VCPTIESREAEVHSGEAEIFFGHEMSTEVCTVGKKRFSTELDPIERHRLVCQKTVNQCGLNTSTGFPFVDDSMNDNVTITLPGKQRIATQVASDIEIDLAFLIIAQSAGELPFGIPGQPPDSLFLERVHDSISEEFGEK